MIRIPAHLKLDFDSLSPAQQRKFMELAHWSSAGNLSEMVITDASFERIFQSIKQMGEEPIEPIQPDKSVNHDWDFDPKQNKGQ